MSDTVVILSSDEDDTQQSEKDVKKQSPKREPEKRIIEELNETSKKRKIQPLHLGSREPNRTRRESNGSANPDDELHDAVFKEFVDTCFKVDNSVNMQKIIDKKLKKYYSLLVPGYRSSEQFITFLERKGAEIERSSSQRFMHLKEVIDELNVHRSDKIDSSSAPKASDRFIRKLCKAMELLHRKIKKLEEKEVDWEDDNESSYMQLQRYRERLMKVHAKLQELEGNTASGFRRKISFSGTQFPKVNRAIEKFVNARGEFPDFHDIHGLLKTSYQTENIEITAHKLKCEAKTVFQSIGEQLQKLRRDEFWEAHRHFLAEDVDPADTDETLKSSLDENKKKFQASIDEIINSYAEKPNKAQFASEDSNSSESVKKEKETANSHSEDEDERDEKEEKVVDCDEDKDNDDKEDVEEDEDKDDDDDDDDDEDEDEDDGEEENENVEETMDDILDDIGKEVQDDSLDSADNLFLYCGPVSPPTPVGEEANSDIVSCHSSPTQFKGQDYEGFEASGDSSTEEKEVISQPGCSKWVNSEEPVKKSSCSSSSSSNNEKSDEIVTMSKIPKSEESKTFLKVKSLSSLQKNVQQKIPEEILLD